MANLLSSTTVGGNAVITTDNIGTYAITSLTDTLATVTGRGATTSTRIDLGASESMRLYGIRGRFTNEYIHLYNKVGIGHPSGWGQGNSDTPNWGLSTYGGINIAYGNGADSIFNGKVGIGTSSPGGKLDVEGTGVAATPTVSLVNTSSSGFNHTINALAPNLTAGENNIFIIGKEANTKNAGYIGYTWNADADNSNVLTFGHWASDNLMNLTGDGKLGIGTTSPSRKLHVSSGNGDVAAKFENTSNNGTVLHLQTTGDGKSMYLQTDHIFVSSGSMHLGNDTGDIYLRTGSGNVGIGTTTPSYKLHVQGTSGSDGFGMFSAGSGGTSGGIHLGYNGTSYGVLYFDNSNNNTYLVQKYSAGNLILGTNSAEKMRITNGGNVLIGTTTDSGEKLQVFGTARIEGDLSFSSQVGTWITSNVMPDAIGWNTNYGVYIGSNVGGTHYLRGNGTFTTGGSTYNLWHAGNDGSGSGLDADTVDGYHQTAFIRLAANSSSPTNGLFAIGSASSRNFIQSHGGQPLDINPIGNAVTIGSSLTVSGVITATGGNSTNWNTAYGWGNHASAGYQPAGNYFTDGDTVLNMANNDGLEYNDTNNLMYVKADGVNYSIIDSRGGSISGSINMTGGGTKISMNNGDIVGVNQIMINDPGEGIIWQNGSSGNIILAVTDDASDNILNLTGTGASLAVNGATVATQSWVGSQSYATQSYVNTQVSNLVDSAPGTLDTLNELAAALGDDANFSTTVTNSIATKLSLAGGTVSGTVDFHVNDTTTFLKSGNSSATGIPDQFYIKHNYGDVQIGNLRGSIQIANGALKVGSNLVWDQGDFTSTDISNWNTAYGWGDHSSAGYLTSFDITTQTDGKYLRSNANDNFTGRLTNNSMNETPSYDKGAINLQPSASGGSIGITFRSKVNSTSDAGYIWWYDDNDHYNELNSAENGVLLIAVQNDGAATSEDAIALESSGDIYLNAGVASGAIGSGVWNSARGNVYLGYAGDRARVLSTDDGNPTQWNTAYGWGNHASAGYLTAHPNISAAGSSNNSGRDFIQDIFLDGNGHILGIGTAQANTIIGTDVDINTSGATIIDNIYVTDGVITSMGTRTLTAADLGISQPNPPTITATNIVGETIEVVFNQSSTSDIDYYQVWSSVDGGSYGMIAQIPQSDIAATMTVIDAEFSVSGTMSYRVYAVKNGIYSNPAQASQAFTAPTLDVVNMSVVNLNTAYYIQYNMPDSRFVDHIEIYMDSEASSGSLSRTGATLVYSGNNTSYMHQISGAALNNYHQFWVEVIES